MLHCAVANALAVSSHAMAAKLMSFLLLGIVRFLTGSRARWYGCPPRPSRHLFANHQSHADMVLIWAALPRSWQHHTALSAKDYWTKTPFRQWITHSCVQAVYVDRQATPPAQPATAQRRGCGAGGCLQALATATADADTAMAGGPDPSPEAPPLAPTPKLCAPPFPVRTRCSLVRALESGDPS